MQITDIAIDDNKKIIVDKFDFLLQEIDILFDTIKHNLCVTLLFSVLYDSKHNDSNLH